MKNRKMTVLTSVCACAVVGFLLGLPAGDARGEKATVGAKSAETAQVTQGDLKLQIPFGLDESAVVIPDDNPLTTKKVELGRLLFFPLHA